MSNRSESMKKFWSQFTPEERKEIIKQRNFSNKGGHMPEEAKEKIRKARAKQHQVFDEKARANMSKGQKKYWASLSGEERAKKLKTYIAAPRSKTKDTKIELKIENQLKALNIKYEKQKYFYNNRAERGFYIDFYISEYNGFEVLIECNGDYWHNLEHRKQRDKLLIDLINNPKNTKHKLKLLMLSEHDILENDNLLKEKMGDLKRSVD